MVEDNQEHHIVDPASISGKRKRGRPRKDDAAGTESSKRRQHRSTDQMAHGVDIIVGQAVHGVLDGRFDAGYMLTVRVGGSGTVLSGLVFEPSQSIPISSANDVAPHIPMLKRADVHIPRFETFHQSPSLDRTPVLPRPITVTQLHAEAASKLPTASLIEIATIEGGPDLPQKVACSALNSLKIPLPASPHLAIIEANSNAITAQSPAVSEPKGILSTESKEPAIESKEMLITESKETLNAAPLEKHFTQCDGSFSDVRPFTVVEEFPQAISELKNVKTPEGAGNDLGELNPSVMSDVAVPDTEKIGKTALDLLGGNVNSRIRSFSAPLSGYMRVDEIGINLSEQRTSVNAYDLSLEYNQKDLPEEPPMQSAEPVPQVSTRQPSSHQAEGGQIPMYMDDSQVVEQKTDVIIEASGSDLTAMKSNNESENEMREPERLSSFPKDFFSN